MDKSVASLWRRVSQYLENDLVIPASAALESIIAKDPHQPRAHMLLGGIAWKEDNVRRATEHGLAAAHCYLMTPELVCDVIDALMQVGESARASRFFDHPLLTHRPLSLPLLMRLSGQAQVNGEHARSLDFLERARAAGASGADFDCYLGVQLTFNGRLQEAERALEACVRVKPAAGRAGLILSRLRKQTPEHNHLQNLQEGLRQVVAGTEDHAALEFARYKELEDLGRREDAWQALSSANAIVQSAVQHDPDVEAQAMQRLIECTAGWTAPDCAERLAGSQPIFVLGMPRSGTTLLDRILGNHSQISSAGELADLGWQMRWAVDHRTGVYPDARALDRLNTIDFAELGRRYLQHTQWRAGNKPFYVDKNPQNWVLAGLIARALPRARILHLTRDSMDVCFSNYRAFLGYGYAYSYGLRNLARHYLAYRRVMAHWHALFPGRILDVAYRDLVTDAPGIARRVFDFCGLEFEPDCVDVTRNRHAIATLSMVQARESIHSGNFGQWRSYAEWLTPLQMALAAD